MAKHEYARLVAVERAAFAEVLRGLTEEQWAAQSLCTDWTVRDVAAHVAGTNTLAAGGAVGSFLRAGLSPDRFNRRQVAAWRARSDEDICSAVGDPELRGLLRLSPAGALTEVFLHQQDVRQPLSAARAYPADCLLAALDASCTALTGTGSKGRIRGLRLRATDVEWSTGDGPEVAGPAAPLVMAMNGRRSAAALLAGEGVAVLSGRA